MIVRFFSGISFAIFISGRWVADFFFFLLTASPAKTVPASLAWASES